MAANKLANLNLIPWTHDLQGEYTSVLWPPYVYHCLWSHIKQICTNAQRINHKWIDKYTNSKRQRELSQTCILLQTVAGERALRLNELALATFAEDYSSVPSTHTAARYVAAVPGDMIPYSFVLSEPKPCMWHICIHIHIHMHIRMPIK